MLEGAFLIFGQAIFGDVTFADIGEAVLLEGGWLDVIKDPCEEEMWVKRGSDCGEYTEIDKKPSNWTVIK